MVQDNVCQPLHRMSFVLAGAALLLGVSGPARAQVSFEVLASGPRGGTMEVSILESVAGSGCVVSETAVYPGVLILTIPWQRDVVPVVRRVVTDCD